MAIGSNQHTSDCLRLRESTYQSSRLIGVPLFVLLTHLLTHLQKSHKNQYLCRFKGYDPLDPLDPPPPYTEI